MRLSPPPLLTRGKDARRAVPVAQAANGCCMLCHPSVVHFPFIVSYTAKPGALPAQRRVRDVALGRAHRPTLFPSRRVLI
jgi:hypothetical protein